ncbi:MAG: heme exporter protein CcmB [Planctomycetota bacterium]
MNDASTTPTVAAPPPAPARRPVSRQFGVLLWREWRLEWRTRETVVTTAVFAAVVVLILSFSVAENRAAANAVVQAALLWITFTFATTLGIGRAFARERDAGALDALLLAPLDWSLIYLAKLVSTVVFTLLAQSGTLVLFIIFFGLAPTPLQVLQIVGLMVAVTCGHVAVGLLVAGMTVGLRAREMLLPVLLFPLLIPLFLAALRSTVLILTGGLTVIDPAGEALRWLGLIVAFDFAYLALGVALFPHVVR